MKLRCFPLGRKALTNLDGVWKCRDVTLPTKVWIVKATVFPVVMYECESWTRISKIAQQQRPGRAEGPTRRPAGSLVRMVIWPHSLRLLRLADPHRDGLVLSSQPPRGRQVPTCPRGGRPTALAQGCSHTRTHLPWGSQPWRPRCRCPSRVPCALTQWGSSTWD